MLSGIEPRVLPSSSVLPDHQPLRPVWACPFCREGARLWCARAVLKTNERRTLRWKGSGWYQRRDVYAPCRLGANWRALFFIFTSRCEDPPPPWSWAKFSASTYASIRHGLHAPSATASIGHSLHRSDGRTCRPRSKASAVHGSARQWHGPQHVRRMWSRLRDFVPLLFNCPYGFTRRPSGFSKRTASVGHGRPLTPKRMAEIRRVEASRADLHHGHRRPSRMLRLTGRDE